MLGLYLTCGQKCFNDYSVGLEHVNSCKFFSSANVNDSTLKDNGSNYRKKMNELINSPRFSRTTAHVRGFAKLLKKCLKIA